MKKKIPVEEHKDFLKACEKTLTMYATSKSDTKRCYIGICHEPDLCMVLFKGNPDDLWKIKKILEEK